MLLTIVIVWIINTGFIYWELILIIILLGILMILSLLEEIQSTLLHMKKIIWLLALLVFQLNFFFFFFFFFFFLKVFFSESDFYRIIKIASSDVHYSDCAKNVFLLSLFNKIWDGDFPLEEWNSASIISIP